jgi:hypothetical protein
MTELVDRLVADAGLSPEQAQKTIAVIKSVITEKFPMLSGAVDNILGPGAAPTSAPAPAAESGGGWMDKISDMIPGEMGEKLEGFAKKAADATMEGYEKAKDAAQEGFEKAKDTAEDLLAKGKAKLDELDKKM